VISVLLIASLVLAILVFLTAQLVQAAAGAVLVRTAFEDGLVQQLLSDHPKVAPFLKRILDQFNTAGLAADAATWLTNVSANMLRGSVVQISGILLSFYMLFYFLRDYRPGLAALRSFLPFTEGRNDGLIYQRRRCGARDSLWNGRHRRVARPSRGCYFRICWSPGTCALGLGDGRICNSTCSRDPNDLDSCRRVARPEWGMGRRYHRDDYIHVALDSRQHDLPLSRR